MHVLLREPNKLNLMSNPFFLESFDLAMPFTSVDSFLSSDQDTNRFFV